MHGWGGIVVAVGSRPQSDEDTREISAPWLFPVANRPLLDHAIRETAHFGAERIIVAVGQSLAAPVRETIGQGAPDELSVIAADPGADALAVIAGARHILECSQVIVHAADALVEHDLAGAMERVDSGAVDAVVVVSPEVPATRSRPRGQGGQRFRRAGREAGVMVLGKAALDLIDTARHDARPADLDEVSAFLADAGARVDVATAPTSWRYRPGSDALLEAHRLVLDRLVVDAPDDQDSETLLHGRVEIDPTAVVRRSVIRGPVIIGRHARVLDAFVGPYTSIGAGALVEATEIEHSVVHPEAELRHVGYRIEASIIGAGARVSRSFSLPKALHLEIGSGARVTVS